MPVALHGASSRTASTGAGGDQRADHGFKHFLTRRRERQALKAGAELVETRAVASEVGVEDHVAIGALAGEDITVSTIVVRSQRPFRPARPHSASAAELALHAEFLATIKSPLWAA